MSHSRRSVWPWFAAALALIAFDQITKALIRHNFELYESVPLIGNDFLRLTYVHNPGIAFGLEVAGPVFLLIFGWAAAIMLAVYLYRLARQQDVLAWPVMFFLAGAIGNSIDRTLFGVVTDFLDADFPNAIMERWPVFNVADSCVTVGIALLLYFVLFDHRKRLHTDPAAAADPVPVENHARDSLSSPLPTDHGSGPAAGAD